MAYVTTNPPKKIAGGIGGGQSLWIYVSDDVGTDVDAANYFSDGDALGMKVEDIILVGDNTSPFGVTPHLVTIVTAGGAASLGDPI